MGQAIDGNEVRKRMLWGVVAACAISNGQAQDEALLAPFREIERFARDLKSVADMRNECLRLDPSRANEVLAAYGRSSASVYPDLLKLSDPSPIPANGQEPPAEGRASSAEGAQACIANLSTALTGFDAQYASRQDEIKFIRNNAEKVQASLRARNASPPQEIRSNDDALSKAGAKVRVVVDDPFSVYASCTFEDNLLAVSSSADGATIVLRNETARRGNDTLIVVYMRTSEAATAVGATTFRCN